MLPPAGSDPADPYTRGVDTADDTLDLAALAAPNVSPVLGRYMDRSWSHGIGHEATIVNFLHDAGLLPVLIQLAFVASLYVWSTSGYRPPDEILLSDQQHR